MTVAPIVAAASLSACCIVTKYGLFSSWKVMPIFRGAACAAGIAASDRTNADAASASAVRTCASRVFRGANVEVVCVMVVSIVYVSTEVDTEVNTEREPVPRADGSTMSFETVSDARDAREVRDALQSAANRANENA